MIIHILNFYIQKLPFIHYTVVVLYIYCIVFEFYYVNYYSLLVTVLCETNIYFLDMFNIQLLVDEVWIFEMNMKCKWKWWTAGKCGISIVCVLCFYDYLPRSLQLSLSDWWQTSWCMTVCNTRLIHTFRDFPNVPKNVKI
jgi:hypothetical protein